MNRTTENALLLSALCIALSANAWGQDKPKANSMDTDGNGLISVQEHVAGAKAMFGRMDTDGDGSLTAAEMDAAHAMMMKGSGMARGHQMPGKGMGMGHGMPAGGMMAMDSNADGEITAQEHAVGAKAMFEKLDANSDGKVTTAELATGHQAMMQGHKAMMQGMRTGMDMGAMSSADMIGRMDRDDDGKVSATEHAAAAQAMFDHADTDKDRNLSQAEREAHHQGMMKR